MNFQNAVVNILNQAQQKECALYVTFGPKSVGIPQKLSSTFTTRVSQALALFCKGEKPHLNLFRLWVLTLIPGSKLKKMFIITIVLPFTIKMIKYVCSPSQRSCLPLLMKYDKASL